MTALPFSSIAVLFGGTSSEREISLQSGRAVLEALGRLGIPHEGFDTKEGLDPAKLKKHDRVFIALHGESGEDGKVQGYLDTLGISYTGSGVLGSALAMDKARTKWILEANRLATPPGVLLPTTPSSSLPPVFESLGSPLIAKPQTQGSSIGLRVVRTEAELQEALAYAGTLGTHCLVEQHLPGEEYSVSIVGKEILPPVRIDAAEGLFDYQAKYGTDQATHVACPCGLPQTKLDQLKELAENAFSVLGCSGWGRVDIKADADGKFFVLEVNTAPGLTEESLVPISARQLGWNFDELIKRILIADL